MSTIEQVPADPGNYTHGRGGTTPSMVVIHVADGSYRGTLTWFSQAAAPASAHYTVGMDGAVGQSVQERDTAWHSGKWDMNQRSIGIEHEGWPSKEPWTPSETQLQASAELVALICERYRIPPNREHIIGHNEVDPARKARAGCPGPTWPWERYIAMVQAAMKPAPGHVKDGKEQRSVRLFDPQTNEQVGLGTLIEGTDKCYLFPETLANLRRK